MLPMASIDVAPGFSPARYRRVASVALTLLYAIVVTGATVRLTGSGLGCPDWPSCHGGRPVPALESHQLVEFVNRMVAFPTLVAALWSWLAARRLRPVRRDLRIASGLAIAGVLAQIVLGGITVRFDLHPLLVSSHFALSMLILAAATFAWRAAAHPAGRRLGTMREWSLPALLLPVAAVVIAAGVLTTASGPHSGAAPGSPVTRLGHGELVVMLHARGAYLFAALVVAIAIRTRRRLRAAHMVPSQGTRGPLAILAALIAVQIALGEIQFRTGLPWGVVLAHVATAGLIWIITCRIAIDAASAPDVGSLDTGDPQLTATEGVPA